MGTLSILCPTRDPGERVVALLSQLRPVADEIVVLANVETDRRDVACYATIADRLLFYEFAMPGERLSAWAHAQCSGDWILVIHGDEVASPGLVNELARVKDRRDLLQAYIPRRWVFPDGEHWLDESPWAPDYSLRLVRNDPAVLWFPGQTHTTAAAARPAAFLEAPIYHLDCLVNSLRERSAKVDAYERDLAGLTTTAGEPANLYYLPEKYATRQPAEIPPADLLAVNAVLRPTPVVPLEADFDGIPTGTRAEIDEMWDLRPLSDASRQAKIELIDSDLRFAPGECRGLTIRVHNVGDTTWPGGLERHPHINLCYLGPNGEGPRSPLPSSIAPGQAIVALVTVVAEQVAGRYPVAIDLVHEGSGWFGQPLNVMIEVGYRQ
ncbi:MAG: hypothetical protein WCK06_10430 [Actinomycetota bacterium]